MKNRIGTRKNDLDTPCLVVDLDRFERNLGIAWDAVHAAGKQLRPHAKTHKCSSIARKQLDEGAIGICAAKVSEAEALVRAGIRGVLVTGPVATSGKAERLMEAREIDPGLIAVFDSFESVRLLAEGAARRGLVLDVLADVDVGQGRTGISPGDVAAFAARIGALPSLRLRGIQAYAGHAQHVVDRGERRRISLESLGPAAEVFRRLASEYGCDVFSGAGTGTYDIDLEIPELTEMQLGSYIFMDVEYLDIGWEKNNPPFQPALTLLASVVNVNHKGYITVDAGLKTLYRDGGVPRVVWPEGPGWRYEWFGDEYGKIVVPENVSVPKLGEKIELVVSHCDPTVNLFDCLYAVRNDMVSEIWDIDLRGKSW